MNIGIPLFLLMLTLITLCAHGKALNTDRFKWVKGQYKHYSKVLALWYVTTSLCVCGENVVILQSWKRRRQM